MLQLSQVLLPVDHRDEDLRTAVIKTLGVRDEEVISLKVKQRAIDARRGHVELSFTLLVEVKEEARLLKSELRQIRADLERRESRLLERERRLDEEARRQAERARQLAETEAGLRAFVADRLAAFKVPIRVIFWPETLPRNANGKLVKRDLRMQLLAMLAPTQGV